jgi:hypothetical protein
MGGMGGGMGGGMMGDIMDSMPDPEKDSKLTWEEKLERLKNAKGMGKMTTIMNLFVLHRPSLTYLYSIDEIKQVMACSDNPVEQMDSAVNLFPFIQGRSQPWPFPADAPAIAAKLYTDEETQAKYVEVVRRVHKPKKEKKEGQASSSSSSSSD